MTTCQSRFRMQILPVLDIQQGTVVRGIGGRRHEYRPVISKWTASGGASGGRGSAARRVWFSELLSCRSGCDLLKASPNWDVYGQLQSRGFLLAVDAGVRGETDGRRLLESGVDCVAGLETSDGPAALQRVRSCEKMGTGLATPTETLKKRLANRCLFPFFTTCSTIPARLV